MSARGAWGALGVLSLLASACSDDASSSGSSTSAGGASASSGDSSSVDGSGVASSSAAGMTTSSTADASSASSGSGGGGPCAEGTLVFASDFEGANGSWPAPWKIAGGVATQAVSNGEAHLVPAPASYPLARMALPASVVNSESTFAMHLSAATQQGIGFYARQNGGYLAQTDPDGQGYAIFTHGFSGNAGIGSWYEGQGVGENQLQHTQKAIASNVLYRVRVRVEQEGMSSTHVRGRVWADGMAEPQTWDVDTLDATRPELQGLAGGFAIDSWHNPGNGAFEDAYVDDVVICAL